VALVDRAGHDPFKKEELDPLLELADEHHPLVKPQEEIGLVRN
jgi:hypothetical protein